MGCERMCDEQSYVRVKPAGHKILKLMTQVVCCQKKELKLARPADARNMLSTRVPVGNTHAKYARKKKY